MKKIMPQLSEIALGTAIRRARVFRRLTQAELAHQADLSLTAVRNLERGQGANLRSFVHVAQVLGLSDVLTQALDQAVPADDSPMKKLAAARRGPQGALRVRHKPPTAPAEPRPLPRVRAKP